jgi:hypothetical protein
MTTQTTDPLTLTEQTLKRTCENMYPLTDSMFKIEKSTDYITVTERPIEQSPAFRLGTAIGLLEGWSNAMEMSEPMRGWMIDIMTRHTNEWIKEQANEPNHG